MKKEPKLTVYLLEFAGKTHMNGNVTPFIDMMVYYLDSRKKAVYSEWLLTHMEETHDPTPSCLVRVGKVRSMRQNEARYYADATRMGKLFSDITTHVTKLGEL